MCVETSHHSTSTRQARVFEDAGTFERWIRLYLERKREEGPVVFLDSQLEGHEASRFGYIAANPVDSVRATAGNPRNQHAWNRLKTFHASHNDWMFGWLGYDLKNETEDLQSHHPDPVGLPDLYFFVPGVLLWIDRQQRKIEVLKGDDEELHSISGFNDTFHFEKPQLSDSMVSGDGWEAYRQKVNDIKAYITQGDTYEVNLTHQLNSRFHGDSLDLFDSMRKAGPVPFAAWLHYGDTSVCCASPERFLEYKNGMIRSQPIKGTSPRGKNPEEDKQIVSEILRKEKNRAENVMIVDLVRHDLGQIARKNTVQVESLLEVQSFSTVHQLVSTITALPEDNITPVEMIQACFPMGSMTGAPKIRTMEIIEQLESYRRGIYSGAIGYFQPSGAFDFNVVIRTAVIRDDQLYYAVGGAITADSDPMEEWNESWLKARALTLPLDPQKNK